MNWKNILILNMLLVISKLLFNMSQLQLNSDGQEWCLESVYRRNGFAWTGSFKPGCFFLSVLFHNNTLFIFENQIFMHRWREFCKCLIFELQTRYTPDTKTGQICEQISGNYPFSFCYKNSWNRSSFFEEMRSKHENYHLQNQDFLLV